MLLICANSFAQSIPIGRIGGIPIGIGPGGIRIGNPPPSGPGPYPGNPYPGNPNNPQQGQVCFYTDANYQGFVALEYEATEDPWVAVPRALKQMKEAFAA